VISTGADPAASKAPGAGDVPHGAARTDATGRSAGAGRILVAGIGNVFLGDDGFGVEVVRRMRDIALPERVDIADYGIRGLHLAYDLLEGRHDILVIVDALPLGEPPGTVAVLDVDLDNPDWMPQPSQALEAPVADGHGMDPESVLRLLRGLGGRVTRVLVVGCQPAVLEERMELSPAVRNALDEAVRTVIEVAHAEAARLDAAEAVCATAYPTAPGAPVGEVATDA